MFCAVWQVGCKMGDEHAFTVLLVSVVRACVETEPKSRPISQIADARTAHGATPPPSIPVHTYRGFTGVHSSPAHTSHTQAVSLLTP